MNTSIIILFYSQYSQSCIDLIKTLSSTTLDVRLLCIDKKKIKDHVLSDTRYQVRVVPTILVLHSDGNTEKYEEGAAGQWLIRLMNSMNQTMTEQKPFFTEIPLEKEEPAVVQESVPEPTTVPPEPKPDPAVKTKTSVQMMAQQMQRQREMDIKNDNNLKIEGVPQNESA
jgi:vacuolar-type H+-ATPase subunit F/Vma7